MKDTLRVSTVSGVRDATTAFSHAGSSRPSASLAFRDLNGRERFAGDFEYRQFAAPNNQSGPFLAQETRMNAASTSQRFCERLEQVIGHLQTPLEPTRISKPAAHASAIIPLTQERSIDASSQKKDASLELDVLSHGPAYAYGNAWMEYLQDKIGHLCELHMIAPEYCFSNHEDAREARSMQMMLVRSVKQLILPMVREPHTQISAKAAADGMVDAWDRARFFLAQQFPNDYVSDSWLPPEAKIEARTTMASWLLHKEDTIARHTSKEK